MAIHDVDRAAQAPATPTLLPPPHPTIVPATDLGGVGVLKHGNLYLLSDQFGDVHPDSRGLGLYDLDTRVLSCAVLRLNGVRPTLLRAQSAASHISTIQLTNPELRRDPATKQGTVEALAQRAISVMRRRWIAGGLAEHIEVTNYSSSRQEISLELELDADAADIFEVRGTDPGPARHVPIDRVDVRNRSSSPTKASTGCVRRTLVSFTPADVADERRRRARARSGCAGTSRSNRASVRASAGRCRPTSRPRPVGPTPPRRRRRASRAR